MAEILSRPVVAAIIEREVAGKKQILVQTRYKPSYDPKYSGALEIPAGQIKEYENVFEALKREVKEETGLTIKKINGESKNIFEVQGDQNLGFNAFFCSQILKGPHPYITFYFICEVEEGKLIPQEKEVRDPKWMDVHELKNLLETEPDGFFILHVAALKNYLSKV
jgi:8-oxo-dGTP pyrophosphatase MutT (NUDIX family)